MAGRLFCALVLALGVGCAAARAPDAGRGDRPDGATPARVVRVTDGDTVVLKGIEAGEVHVSTGGRKARLIGIDTPELSECFGDRASDFTRAELDGREVSVGFDEDPTDRFGRALVYLWRNGELFNARLVADGFATPLRVRPNLRYAALFDRLAAEARGAGRGLWRSCSLGRS